MSTKKTDSKLQNFQKKKVCVKYKCLVIRMYKIQIFVYRTC